MEKPVTCPLCNFVQEFKYERTTCDRCGRTWSNWFQAIMRWLYKEWPWTESKPSSSKVRSTPQWASTWFASARKKTSTGRRRRNCVRWSTRPDESPSTSWLLREGTEFCIRPYKAEREVSDWCSASLPFLLRIWKEKKRKEVRQKFYETRLGVLLVSGLGKEIKDALVARQVWQKTRDTSTTQY